MIKIPDSVWDHKELTLIDVKIWGEVSRRGEWDACNYEIGLRFGIPVGEVRSSIARLRKNKLLKGCKKVISEFSSRRVLMALQ